MTKTRLEPATLSAESQEELLRQVIQLVKEYYGDAAELDVRIEAHLETERASRVLLLKDDKQIPWARITFLEANL